MYTLGFDVTCSANSGPDTTSANGLFPGYIANDSPRTRDEPPMCETRACACTCTCYGHLCRYPNWQHQGTLRVSCIGRYIMYIHMRMALMTSSINRATRATKSQYAFVVTHASSAKKEWRLLAAAHMCGNARAIRHAAPPLGVLIYRKYKCISQSRAMSRQGESASRRRKSKTKMTYACLGI